MLMLLDLDNTLVDRERAFCTWAAEFVRELGGFGHDREWLIAADANGYAPRQTLAAKIQARFGLTTPVPDLVHRLLLDHVEIVECYPGVLDKLEELRSVGDRLVVVTNGTIAQQSMKIRLAELSGLVDGVVISESVGVKKPEPKIFRQALRYRADNSVVWMVGDNPRADIRGAQDIGLLTGWVSHNTLWEGAEPPTITQPTTVRVLEEIHLSR